MRGVPSPSHAILRYRVPARLHARGDPLQCFLNGRQPYKDQSNSESAIARCNCDRDKLFGAQHSLDRGTPVFSNSSPNCFLRAFGSRKIGPRFVQSRNVPSRLSAEIIRIYRGLAQQEIGAAGSSSKRRFARTIDAANNDECGSKGVHGRLFRCPPWRGLSRRLSPFFVGRTT